jgi:CIC family chloride channel protein
VFATESLAQALRQLEVYGRDGLPVLSADGQQVAGWVTNTSVLRAVAREISSSAEQTAEAQAAADWDHDTPASTAEAPANPLPGYRIIEITIHSS